MLSVEAGKEKMDSNLQPDIKLNTGGLNNSLNSKPILTTDERMLTPEPPEEAGETSLRGPGLLPLRYLVFQGF